MTSALCGLELALIAKLKSWSKILLVMETVPSARLTVTFCACLTGRYMSMDARLQARFKTEKPPFLGGGCTAFLLFEAKSRNSLSALKKRKKFQYIAGFLLLTVLI